MNKFRVMFFGLAANSLLRCVLLASVVAGLAPPRTTYAQDRKANAQLTQALKQLDAVAIRSAVAEQNRQLGEKAGLPEPADKYVPLRKDGQWYSLEEAQLGFQPWFKKLESLRWWRVGLNPTHLNHPLREPAAVISGNVAVCRAKLKGADRSLELAQEAADFLIWAQEQGGTGVFPFPAVQGVVRDNAFVSADNYLRRVQQAGKLDEVVKNGWIVKDNLTGGLQYDNGESGVALLELYELTHNTKYLDAAKKAADWALDQPLFSNWNYNSFSVYLLARAYRITGEKKYLEGAVKKALLGVIPGQLTQGPNAGRWNDAHNARAVYHYILLRGLAELAAVLPQHEASRRTVMTALQLGLTTRNRELLDQGVATKDLAMEVLVFINRNFANDKEFLNASRSSDALDALAKVVSEQARHAPSLGPRAWGLFLEYIVWKSSQ